MARRRIGNMSGERYLANSNPTQLEVHDLDNEKAGANQCQIDKIIAAGHDRPYTSLVLAHLGGYDNCQWCLGGSTR